MLKVLSVFFCLLYALCLPLGKAYGQSSASEPGNQPILMRVNEWYDEVKKKPKQSYEVLKAKPGVMHGVFDLWYPNGVKKTKGHYEKGKPSGIWENYYENGKLKSAGPLDAHGSRGHWKFYNENGHINREGTLNGDIKEGHWKFYGEGGKLTHEGYYQNGKLHGAWKYYKPDGSLKARADYKMGRGIYTELHNNGAPASRGLVVNG
ncbi:MAG: toxin-antitoxin system YwqK family antitoxin, partial [Bacteroidota bacterium]